MAGAIVEYIDGELRATCPATAAKCRCRHEPDHPPPHECQNTEECNGAWLGSDADGDEIQPVRFPLAGGLGNLADLLFGGR